SLSRRHDPMKGSGAASDCRTPAQSATTVAEPRQCSPSIRWNSNSVVLPVASALLAEEGTVGVAVIEVGQHLIVLQEKTPVYRSDCGTSYPVHRHAAVFGVAEDARVPQVVAGRERGGVGGGQCWKQRVAVEEMNSERAGAQQRGGIDGVHFSRGAGRRRRR